MIFADKVRPVWSSEMQPNRADAFETALQRFAKADKVRYTENCCVDLVADLSSSVQRAKLPKWIGSYIKDADTNLSTDLAIAHSKKFLRAMAQPFQENSKSAWGMEQIKEKQMGLDPNRNKDLDGDDEDVAMLDGSGGFFAGEVPEEDEIEKAFGEIDDEALMMSFETGGM